MNQNYIKYYFFLAFTLVNMNTHPSWWFNIIPAKELIKQNPNIGYHKCHDEIPFYYEPFPLSINQANHPNQGYFKETFIVTIPNGIVQSYGLVLIDNQFIQELIWKDFRHNLAHVQKFNHNQIMKVPGRVAVIGQAAFHNYFHWISEVLCRLALLELQGMQYDYLYVPQESHFMQETLQLWGIPTHKIIAANQNTCIQAEQLIVPSLVSNVSFGGVLGSCYVQQYLINYVQEKLLTAALKQKASKKLATRIFISRKDAPQRQIRNEDDVFQLFQDQGFVRYELDKLSVTDQILLFHNAKIIVSPQGTGLANSIFCTQNTKIIELLQGLNDCTFWYISQSMHLDYTPIKTTTFITDYVSAWQSNTYMPLTVIKSVIDCYVQ